MLWLLDCEGAEPLVLEGSRRSLEAFTPLLILEWQPSRQPELWAACVDLLRGLGVTHLLACSSLVGGELQQDRLSSERLADQRFEDNVLIYAMPRHGPLVARLRVP